MNTTLTITMTQTGQLKVDGPVDQTGLCYMMLELAKDAVRDHAKARAASPIVLPPPGLRLVPNGKAE